MKAIDRFLEFLEMKDENRTDMYGGYPSQVAVIKNFFGYPKFIIEATADHENAPELFIWSGKEVLRWHRRAVDFHRHYPEETWSTAFFETW